MKGVRFSLRSAAVSAWLVLLGLTGALGAPAVGAAFEPFCAAHERTSPSLTRKGPTSPGQDRVAGHPAHVEVSGRG